MEIEQNFRANANILYHISKYVFMFLLRSACVLHTQTCSNCSVMVICNCLKLVG